MGTQANLNDVNILNVLEVQPDELGFWLASVIINEDVLLPPISANAVPNIQTQIAPLLPVIINRQNLVSQLIMVVVGSTPTATSVRVSGEMAGAVKSNKEELNRKKAVLEQAFDQLKANYAAASRIISCYYTDVGI